jgi:hypothetical protein
VRGRAKSLAKLGNRPDHNTPAQYSISNLRRNFGRLQLATPMVTEVGDSLICPRYDLLRKFAKTCYECSVHHAYSCSTVDPCDSPWTTPTSSSR